MGEWKECTLADVAAPHKKAIISGPFGSNIGSRFFVQTGIPVIRGNNLSLRIGERFIDDGFVFLTEEKAEELGTWAEEDDLIFTAAGTIGQVGIINGSDKYKRYIISNKQLRVTLDKSKIAPLFGYYWFSSPIMTDTIMNRDTGSTIPLINLSVLRSLPILLPSLPEQKAIATILSSLDDKIDLLHRQNKTLEALAETLFRKWFIEDADPKWKKGKLGDYVSVKGGTTPSTSNSEFWNGNICWTSPRDLSNAGEIFLHDTSRKITEKGLAQIGSGLLPIGTVLLSSRAPIGYLTITNVPVAINQGYIAVLCEKLFSKYYTYLWIRLNMETIVSSANGSTFLEISKSVFKELEVDVPSEDLLTRFELSVKPMFQKILSNELQIRTLEKLRDSLLPKLMSGEIRVNY